MNNQVEKSWHILFIDDDGDDYRLACENLAHSKGHEIHIEWARSFTEGTRKMEHSLLPERFPYDAVLVDDELNGQRGIDLIRKYGPSYPAPLIFYASQDSYEIDIEAQQAGATMYLAKHEANSLLLERIIRYAIERKQSELALRSSEEREKETAGRLKEILENSLDVAYRRDLVTDRYDYMSPVVEQILGFTAEAMNEMSIEEVFSRIHPDDLPATVVGLAKAAEEGKGKLDYRFRCKDGSYRWIADHVTVTKDEDGRLLYRTGSLRDITTRKLTEEALQESEARFRTMADGTPVIIWVTRPDGGIEFINEAYSTFFGVTLKDVQAGGWSMLVHPEDTARYVDFFMECSRQQVPYRAQGRVLRQDGEWRWIDSYGQPRFSEAGMYLGIAGSSLDITDRIRAESELKHYAAELERSNQALKDFTFMASHDLQEPLRKVLAFGDILENRFRDSLDEEGCDYLKRITNATRRMAQMLQSLLSYSRITTHAVPFSEVDLQEVTREVISDLDVRLQETNGRVDLEELPHIQGDSSQIRQLLMNLISNALKYHRPGEPPRVTISSKPGGDHHVQILVIDNGIGFEMEESQRIFQPFIRLHGRYEYEGTGMGLAICQKIVERHSGRIWAESAPGAGTTFFVELPSQLI